MALYTPVAKEEQDEEYEPLQSPGDSDEDAPNARWKQDSEKLSVLSRALPALSILISVASLAIALTRSGLLYYGSSLTYSEKSHVVDQRSAYVGIERVIKLKNWTTVYPDIQSVPLYVIQISSANPDAVMPDDRPHVWTSFGTAFPEARHVIVNATMSTVMQVRALDYGMEDCRLAVSLPPSRVLDPILSESDPVSPPTLNIWLLDSTKRADLRQMTYHTRPNRVRQLGAFDISVGGNGTTEGYSCASAIPYYVELECAGEGCELVFWQDKVTDVPSVSLLQKSTLS